MNSSLSSWKTRIAFFPRPMQQDKIVWEECRWVLGLRIGIRAKFDSTSACVANEDVFSNKVFELTHVSLNNIWSRKIYRILWKMVLSGTGFYFSKSKHLEINPRWLKSKICQRITLRYVAQDISSSMCRCNNQSNAFLKRYGLY